MQAMPVIILRKLILRSVQRKLTIRDTVAITSDQTTIVIIRKSYILSDIIIPKHNIRHLTVLIRHHHGNQASAPIRYASLSPFLILQHIQSSRLTIYLRYKIRLHQTRKSGLFRSRPLLILTSA